MSLRVEPAVAERRTYVCDHCGMGAASLHGWYEVKKYRPFDRLMRADTLHFCQAMCVAEGWKL